MRSAHTVLPSESQEAFDARMAVPGRSTGSPIATPARHDVERAVKIKLVRRAAGERAGDAQILKKLSAMAREAADRDAADLERLVTQLAARPAATIRQLRKTITGLKVDPGASF